MREPRRRQGEHGRRYPLASGHKALRTPSHFVHQEALPSHCRGRAFHKRRSATRNSRRFSHLHPSSEQSPNHHNLRGLSSNLSGLSACAIACHDQNELIRILARAKKKSNAISAISREWLWDKPSKKVSHFKPLDPDWHLRLLRGSSDLKVCLLSTCSGKDRTGHAHFADIKFLSVSQHRPHDSN